MYIYLSALILIILALMSGGDMNKTFAGFARLRNSLDIIFLAILEIGLGIILINSVRTNKNGKNDKKIRTLLILMILSGAAIVISLWWGSSILSNNKRASRWGGIDLMRNLIGNVRR